MVMITFISAKSVTALGARCLSNEITKQIAMRVIMHVRDCIMACFCSYIQTGFMVAGFCFFFFKKDCSSTTYKVH